MLSLSDVKMRSRSNRLTLHLEVCSPPPSHTAAAVGVAPPPIIRASFISFEIRWEGNLGSMRARARTLPRAVSLARAVSLHPSER